MLLLDSISREYTMIGYEGVKYNICICMHMYIHIDVYLFRSCVLHWGEGSGAKSWKTYAKKNEQHSVYMRLSK